LDRNLFLFSVIVSMADFKTGLSLNGL